MSTTRSVDPPGWEFNPSARGQRDALVVASVAGFVASIVCMMHARGWIAALWEPFPRIHQGWVLAPSPAHLPWLDVVAFLVVGILALVGPRDRWRSHPWLPIATGAVAAFEAISAVVRWTIQYALDGSTSTLFTIVAACAIALLPLAADETFAAVVHEERVLRGASPYRDLAGPRGEKIGFRVTDLSGYVAGIGAIAVGIWLLVASVPPRASTHAHELGAIIVTIGALSLAQAARTARWANAAIGVWLMIAPLVEGYRVRGTIHFLIAGLVLLTISVLGDARLLHDEDDGQAHERPA
jgi:hypothetical protein